MRRLSLSRWLAFALIACTSVTCAAAQHRWTVRDSIALSVFLHPGNQYEQSSQVRFSPDGKHFIAATMRGDLKSGKRIATVWLFDSDQVNAYLHRPGAKAFDGAKALLHTGSTSNRDPINGWSWSSDSHSVLYLGTDDEGVRHLYRVARTGGGAVALSRPDQGVDGFEERDGTTVYLAHPAIPASELYQAGGPSLPDIVDATGQNDLPLMFPHWMQHEFQTNQDLLWRVENGRPHEVLSVDHKTPIRLKASKLALSLKGTKLLVTTFVYRIPKSWERYKPLENYPGLQIVPDTPETVGSTGHYRPKQYSVVDLDSGEMSLLADSPIDLMQNFNDAVTAAWSEDGSRIALPGAYPPLKDAGSSGSIFPCTVAVVEIKSRAFVCLQPEHQIDTAKHPYNSRPQMVALYWRDHGRELVAQFAAPNAPNRKSTTVYTLNQAGQWVAKNEPTKPVRQFAVEVKQALDQPPVLVATAANGSTKPLLDPNPQLKDIARGTVSLYHWHDAKGNLWTGALVKPPDFKSGHRYPLVIQTHQLDHSTFFVDGPSASGFAARALAARNMLVLQVDEHVKDEGTSRESEEGAAGYRAAIKQLAKQGLIDSNDVGIITWSHMGPYVLQGLIDQPSAYKAATITEADFNSYPEYLQNIDYMGTEREKMFRAQMGGEKPFGKGLQSWIKNSPGFHLDRICTPILYEDNSPVSLQYGWADYAALRAQDKPVDWFYIRNGDHVLVKPLERLAEQGRNVDWYDYWLNGHKDPNPVKAAEYKLWDAMKASLPVCPKDQIPDLQ